MKRIYVVRGHQTGKNGKICKCRVKPNLQPHTISMIEENVLYFVKSSNNMGKIVTATFRFSSRKFCSLF